MVTFHIKRLVPVVHKFWSIAVYFVRIYNSALGFKFTNFLFFEPTFFFQCVCLSEEAFYIKEEMSY